MVGPHQNTGHMDQGDLGIFYLRERRSLDTGSQMFPPILPGLSHSHSHAVAALLPVAPITLRAMFPCSVWVRPPNYRSYGMILMLYNCSRGFCALVKDAPACGRVVLRYRRALLTKSKRLTPSRQTI